jgi:hypothetical protein
MMSYPTLTVERVSRVPPFALEGREMISTTAESGHDDVPTWKPSRSEWDAFVDSELEKLGITREELERQARERDFQSPDALSLWMMIG